MKFRLIDSGYNTPAMNMAIDEALLLSKLPVLRFYQWKPAGLSLGYFQDISDIDVDFCKKNNIEIVRRLTGGKTVLHDKELTYSIVIDEKLMPKSIIESYKMISKGILSALKKLGVNASMKEEVEKKEASAVCFNEPSYYEIIADGKKIVGSAQTRKNGKLLQHGAVLIDIDAEKYVNCFNLENKDKMIEMTRNRVTSINMELTNNKNKNLDKNGSLKKIKKIKYEDAAKAMLNGFAENFNAKIIAGKFSAEELKTAERLCREKYSAEEWNFKL